MTTTSASAAASVPATRRPRRSKAWIPRQHGAWAMLTVPVLVGLSRSGPDLVHLPLVAFWFAAYFTYNALGVWFASRRKPLNLPPLVTYAALATVLGVIVLVMRPDLLSLVPWFVPLVAIALWCTVTRRERWLLNDVVTIVAACLFGYVVYIAGYSPGGTIDLSRLRMLVATVIMAGYFVGTALYVKTIIRERNSRGYKVASVVYHALWTLAFAGASLFIALHAPPAHLQGMPLRVAFACAVFFAVLAVRAWVLAGRRIRPMVVGLGEIAASAVLFGILVVVW